MFHILSCRVKFSTRLQRAPSIKWFIKLNMFRGAGSDFISAVDRSPLIGCYGPSAMYVTLYWSICHISAPIFLNISGLRARSQNVSGRAAYHQPHGTLQLSGAGAVPAEVLPAPLTGRGRRVVVAGGRAVVTGRSRPSGAPCRAAISRAMDGDAHH